MNALRKRASQLYWKYSVFQGKWRSAPPRRRGRCGREKIALIKNCLRLSYFGNTTAIG
ncbi:MAG TPA: hypothetical protein VFE56_08375 [Candidatus Binataceae bacterium]|nr:hypothetical protein [Candidatus Binataceae bacterium]